MADKKSKSDGKSKGGASSGKRDKPTEVFQEYCPHCRVNYPPSQAFVHSAHTVGQ